MCLFCTPPFICACAHSNLMLGVIESQHMARHKKKGGGGGGGRGKGEGNRGQRTAKHRKR